MSKLSSAYSSNIGPKVGLTLLAGLVGFSASSVSLLLLSAFTAFLVWGVGVAAALLCAYPVWKYYPASDKKNPLSKYYLWIDILFAVGLLFWGAYNITLASEHILTNRDPATYAISAAWLSTQDNLVISVPQTLVDIEGVRAQSAGFAIDKESQNQIYAQGHHVLPALLGAMGKFVGAKHVLALNILFGMTALLAFYVFIRLFLHPIYAVVGSAAMGASLPLVYFARDTYTEPLAMTFTFTGLALLFLAQKTQHVSLWVVSGLAVGAGVLTRVDGYLTVIGVLAFLVYYLFVAKRSQFKTRAVQALSMMAAMAIMSLLAWLDLVVLSRQYYLSISPLLLQEIYVIVLVVIAGSGLIWLSRRQPGIVKRIDRRTASQRGAMTAIAILGAGALLASRPLWMMATSSKQNLLVAGVQRAEGAAILPRTYAEISTQWIEWYIGPVLALLGLLGLAYAAYRVMQNDNSRQKSEYVVPALLVVLSAAAVYLVLPKITPDHIWAARRFLPVIMPGLVFFGLYLVAQIYPQLKFPTRSAKYALIALGIIAIVLPPLLVMRPYAHVKTRDQYAAIQSMCAVLPKQAEVVWIGMGRLEAVMPTRAYCDVPAYNYSLDKVDKPSRTKLSEIAKKARAANVVPVLAVYEHQIGGLIEKSQVDQLTTTNSYVYPVLQQTLTSPPRNVHGESIGMSIAIINDDGTLSRVEQ